MNNDYELFFKCESTKPKILDILDCIKDSGYSIYDKNDAAIEDANTFIVEGSANDIYLKPSVNRYVEFFTNEDYPYILRITYTGTNPPPNLQISYDTKQWTDVQLSANATTSATNIFDSEPSRNIYIRGNNSNGLNDNNNYVNFNFIVPNNSPGYSYIRSRGDIMHLLSYSEDLREIPNEYCFAHLFENTSGLKVPPMLTATTLKPSCYYNLFTSCQALKCIIFLYEGEADESILKYCRGWMNKVPEKNYPFYCSPNYKWSVTRGSSTVQFSWVVTKFNPDTFDPADTKF